MNTQRDALANVISGLGTGRDKNAFNRYVSQPISSAEIVAAYRSSGLVRKVHDIYPLEMTRAGRDWQLKGDDLDALFEVERRLGLWAKIRELCTRARLFGGAALYLGVNRGAPSDRIDAANVRQGDLSFIHVLNPNQLTLGEIDRNPASPFYGEPEYYRLTDSNSTLVDPSRIIPLVYNPIPDQTFQATGLWGDPLLQSLKTVLTNSDLVHQTIAALLPELKADTIAIPGLGQTLLSSEGEQQLTKRIAAAQLFQSMFNTRLLDGGDGTANNPGDRWETRQLNVSGFPQLMDAFIARVAAETDIPLTRLAGTSPGGLNSSGTSEQRDFEKAVNSRQEIEVRPILDRLDPYLAVEAGVKKLPYWSFGPLSQLTEKERMEIEKMRAETVEKLMNTGEFNNADLAASARVAMAESDMWPGLEPEAAEVDAEGAGLLTDAAPVPLYVSRKLKNGKALAAWARSIGLDPIDADEMHVTVLYSRTAVDPIKMGESWNEEIKINAGGPRAVEVFGKGVAVLQFPSWSLESRHREMVELGASHDWPEYLPHVTVAAAVPEGWDASKIVPYSGPLEFGPEIFEPIDDDYSYGV